MLLRGDLVTTFDGQELPVVVVKDKDDKVTTTTVGGVAVVSVDNLAIDGRQNIIFSLQLSSNIISCRMRQLIWEFLSILYFVALALTRELPKHSDANYENGFYQYTGVVHHIEAALLPSNLTMTPYKYLMGVNATRFIRLFEEVGLLHYLDGSDPERAQTLLVPINRAIEHAFPDKPDDDDEEDIDETEEDALKVSAVNNKKRWALYHVVRGQYDSDELAEGRLLRIRSWLLAPCDSILKSSRSALATKSPVSSTV